jgi:hypothetical protein
MPARNLVPAILTGVGMVISVFAFKQGKQKFYETDVYFT